MIHTEPYPLGDSLDYVKIKQLTNIKTDLNKNTSDFKSKLKAGLIGAALTATLMTALHIPSNEVQTITPVYLEIERHETPGEKLFHDHVSMYKIATWVNQTYGVPKQFSYELVQKIVESSVLAGHDPYLILAISAVESNFNPSAVSNKNAQGIIQVKASVHGSVKDLSIAQQLDKGLSVLTDIKYRAKTDDVVEILQRYNGNLKDKKHVYATKVLTIKDALLDVVNSDFGVSAPVDVIKIPSHEVTVETSSISI